MTREELRRFALEALVALQFKGFFQQLIDALAGRAWALRFSDFDQHIFANSKALSLSHMIDNIIPGTRSHSFYGFRFAWVCGDANGLTRGAASVPVTAYPGMAAPDGILANFKSSSPFNDALPVN